MYRIRGVSEQAVSPLHGCDNEAHKRKLSHTRSRLEGVHGTPAPLLFHSTQRQHHAPCGPEWTTQVVPSHIQHMNLTVTRQSDAIALAKQKKTALASQSLSETVPSSLGICLQETASLGK